MLRGREVSIRTDDRLMEMCFGEYEGTETASVCRTAPSTRCSGQPEEYTESVGGAGNLGGTVRADRGIPLEVIDPLMKQGKTC